MHTISNGHSDPGLKREHNEDRWHVDDDLGLFIVSDGMGGHAKGEVASTMAVETVARLVGQDHALIDAVGRGDREATALTALVERAVETAGREIHALGNSQPAHAGMGCTLTALLVAGGKGFMAHVGDSRLYVLRAGQVEQLSQDHTYLAEMQRKGYEPDEAMARRYGHVLSRALGNQAAVAVDTLLFDLLPGDRLLLCSDGISRYITDNDWLATQLAAEDGEAVAEGLVTFANRSGGADNSAAIVVQIAVDEDEAAEVAVQLRTDVQVKLDALASVFLFESMPLAQMSRVLNACNIETWEPEREVIGEGERLASVIIVLQGELALRRGGVEIGRAGPGDELGATSLARPRVARASLVALRRSRLLRLSGEQFETLARARPRLGLALMQRLALRIGDELDEALNDLASRGGPSEPGVL